MSSTVQVDRYRAVRAEEVEGPRQVLPGVVLAEDLTVRDAEPLLRLGALAIVAREGKRAFEQLERLIDRSVPGVALAGREVRGECGPTHPGQRRVVAPDPLRVRRAQRLPPVVGERRACPGDPGTRSQSVRARASARTAKSRPYPTSRTRPWWNR